MHQLRNRSRARIGVLSALAVAMSTVSGCSSDWEPSAPDAGEDVPDIRGEDNFADPYTGEYDEDFAEDIESYDGLEVTLEAEVAEVISPWTFVVTAPDAADVPPLLVVYPEEAELAEGDTVIVAATPDEGFDLQEVEDALGTDLDDDAYDEWADEVYLRASNVEPAPVED